jgi:hypothetical protein
VLRSRRLPAALLVLLAMAAIEAVAWGLLVPALQGPDESSHLTAVSRIADRGKLLSANGEEGLPRELLVTASEAGFGPLIGDLGARPYWTGLDEARWRAAERRLGDHAADLVADPAEGPPVQGANRNPPLYYAYLAIPWRAAASTSFIDRVHLARLFNVPLLLVTVGLTWTLAGFLMPGTWFARPLAAGVVALEPQLSYLAGTVNPDLLLVALFTAFAVLAVRTLQDGLTRGRLAGLGALALAATATHPRGAVLFVVALLVVLIARRVRLVPVLICGALALAALIVLSPHLSPANGSAFSVRQLVSYMWQFYLPRLPFMDPSIGGDYGLSDVAVRTFFGTFGSLEVQFPGWVYDVLLAAVLVALAGFVAALVRHREAVRERRAPALVLLALCALTVGALHVVAYRTLLVDRSDPIIVGRHLLPMVSLVAVGLAAAGRALPLRWGGAYAACVLGGFVLLQLGGLGITLARFYG